MKLHASVVVVLSNTHPRYKVGTINYPTAPYLPETEHHMFRPDTLTVNLIAYSHKHASLHSSTCIMVCLQHCAIAGRQKCLCSVVSSFRAIEPCVVKARSRATPHPTLTPPPSHPPTPTSRSGHEHHHPTPTTTPLTFYFGPSPSVLLFCLCFYHFDWVFVCLFVVVVLGVHLVVL